MDPRKQLQEIRKSNDCQAAQTLAAQMDTKDIFHVLIYAVTDKQSDFTVAVYQYLSDIHRGELFDLAVETQNCNMVQALLPYSNPRFRNSSALQMASATQNQEIFDLLYPLSQPTKALKVMHKYSRAFEYKMLEEAVEQSRIQRALHRAVKPLRSKVKANKKM